MINSITKYRCANMSAALIIAAAAIGLSDVVSAAPDELSECATADGSPLQIVGPRRIIMRCAELESGCKVTFKLTLDDLGLAMDATVDSFEPSNHACRLDVVLKPANRA